MRRNMLVLLALVCFVLACTAGLAEARGPSFVPEVWEDDERGVVCYRTTSLRGDGVALSCVPLESIEEEEGL